MDPGGAEIDREPGAAVGVHPAADPVPCFEDDDALPGVGEHAGLVTPDIPAPTTMVSYVVTWSSWSLATAAVVAGVEQGIVVRMSRVRTGATRAE